MRSFQGNIHQGYPYFKDHFAGRQCTAIAYVALVIASWSSQCIWQCFNSDTCCMDDIVRLGHSLYVNVTNELGNAHNPRNLLHSEVSSRYIQTSYGYGTVQLDSSRFYGVVGLDGSIDVGSYGLHDALQEVFSSSFGSLVTIGDMTIAIFRNRNEQDVYIFDSHARDHEGMVDANGRCVLLQFPDIHECVAYLLQTYTGQQFDISPVVSEFDSRQQENQTNSHTGLLTLGNGASVNEAINFCSQSNSDYSNSKFTDKHAENMHEDVYNQSTQLFTVTHDCMKHLLSVVDPNCQVIHEKENFNSQPTHNIPLHVNHSYTKVSSTTDCLNDAEFDDDAITLPMHEIDKNPNCVQPCMCNVDSMSNQTCIYLASGKSCTSESNHANASIENQTLLSNHTYSINVETQTMPGHSTTNGTHSITVNRQAADVHTLSYDSAMTSSENHTSTSSLPFLSNYTPIRSAFEKSRGATLFLNHTYSSFQNPTNCTINANYVNLTNHTYAISSERNMTVFSGTCELSHTPFDSQPFFQCNTSIDTCTYLCKQYQNYIEMIPNFSCKSCERIMYRDQLYLSNIIEESVGITSLYNLVCCTCKSSLHKKKIPTLAVQDNNLHVENIPYELQNLNLLEKRLISKVNTFFTLVLLPGYPVGQFGEKGYVIHFPVNTCNITNQLWNIDQAKNRFMVIACSCQNRLTPPSLIQPMKVYQALRWLKINNPLYNNIQLPNESTINRCSNSYNSGNIDLTEMSAIPTNYSSDFTIIDLNADNPIELHSVDNAEEMAFPWLFPSGAHGFNAVRQRRLTLNQYYKSRLLNVDDRWRKDISYLINAVNLYEKSQLSNLISIYTRIRKHESQHSSPLTAGDTFDGSNAMLIENSYMFMKQIRGTVAYWKNVLFNLLAMIKNLGSPTLFMTLSSNDYHWEEMAMTLQGKDKDEIDLSQLPLNVQNDPLLTAKHFERRWRALLKYVINGPKKPFGHVTDYFARVEFQARGSPHMHIFLWIQNAPNLLSAQSAEEITKFIDKVICTTVPDQQSNPLLHNLVKSLQIHNHRPYCKRGNTCRFHYPYAQCNETKLIVDMDLIPSSKRFYVTKRSASDSMVNAYNPCILLHWRANMDIQMIGGPYGVAYYVCSYICKSEPDNLKHALSTLIQQMTSSNPAPSPRSKLFRLGMCVLKHRTMSAQEAAYRIAGLQLVWSSRETITVCVLPPHKQFRKLKPLSERQALPTNSTDIFERSKLDSYYERPYCLDRVCLFRFLQNYRVLNAKLVKQSSSDMTSVNPNYIVRRRRSSACIRPITAAQNSIDYFYSLLMLYLPHRHPDEILHPYSDTLKAFQEKYVMLDKEALASCHAIPTIEDAVRVVRISQVDFGNQDSPDSNDIEPDIVVDSLNCEENNGQSVEASNCISTQDVNNIHVQNNHDDIEWHNLAIRNFGDTLESNINNLTPDQLSVFQMVKNAFKNKNLPFHIFITGGAGVGKSYLIEVLVDWLQLCTAQYSGVNPVAVCAPTGVAAFNIKGKTVHSLFQLPVSHVRHDTQYYELSSKMLTVMRREFCHIHTIIIDEISMVGADMLDFMHRRLTVLKQNDALFGGVNIIAVGDFYQLRPVRNKYAFENFPLWTHFTPYFLNQNMRQSQDTTYAALLNRIRVGIILDTDVATLQTRLISRTDARHYSNILHIFPTIAQVTEHNELLQTLLPYDCFTIVAKHTFSNRDINPNEEVGANLIPQDDRDAGGLPFHLKLSAHTRVMLLRNLNTKFGLVNGAIGTVTLVEEIDNDFVIKVKFDKIQLPKSLLSRNGSVTIPPYKQEFLSNGRFIIRETFPITPCWSSTIHKVQGLSLDKAVIHIGPEIFAKGQAYVALSRVKTIQGLYLLSLCPNKISAHPKVIAEYLRLQYISSSATTFTLYISVVLISITLLESIFV